MAGCDRKFRSFGLAVIVGAAITGFMSSMRAKRKLLKAFVIIIQYFMPMPMEFFIPSHSTMLLRSFDFFLLPLTAAAAVKEFSHYFAAIYRFFIFKWNFFSIFIVWLPFHLQSYENCKTIFTSSQMTLVSCFKNIRQ